MSVQIGQARWQFGEFRGGTVSLVGAGPGDVGLLTLKAAARLAEADVVIYDRLVNREILHLARPGAELILAGKRFGGLQGRQERINRLLIEQARAGKRVVRLKGGDPFVFGRGGEEALALSEAGINFEVVCGVTAAVAAAAYAGIPLTHRHFSSTVGLATGREGSDKDQSQIDFAALARLGTVAVYMGLGTLAETCQKLLDEALPAETPVAVVRWGTSPQQRTVVGTLGNIVERTEQAGIDPPVTVIIGQVVKLRDRLNWFEKLPLFGQRVVVTRARQQAAGLAQRLTAAGARVLAAPTIEIRPLEDCGRLDEALSNLQQYDWLVLTSANGAEAVFARMEQLGLDARHLAGLKIAAIGAVTARAISRRFLKVDCQPQKFVSQALAKAMADLEPLTGKRVLLLRAEVAGSDLPEALRQAGATCHDVPVYRTSRPEALPAELVEDLQNGRVDWITFTSSSTVENFVALLGPDQLELLRGRVGLASIGPATSRALAGYGLEATVEACPHTAAALAEAIIAKAGERRDRPGA